MEYSQSGLSLAMKILNQNQEVARHSTNTARMCKQLIPFLPKNYLSISANDICIAALYHDLGKTNWPKKWFYKSKNSLTNEEIKEMQNHPIEGAKLLENLVPGIPREIIELIASHHERPGGIGFPNQLKEVSKETLLLAACDVFCACTEVRGYRNKVLTKKEALEIVAEFAPKEIVDAIIAIQMINKKAE